KPHSAVVPPGNSKSAKLKLDGKLPVLALEHPLVSTDPNAQRLQLRTLMQVVKAVRGGDFSVRMPVDNEGIVAEIGEVLNDIIELNENMANEFMRVRNTVGLE